MTYSEFYSKLFVDSRGPALRVIFVSVQSAKRYNKVEIGFIPIHYVSNTVILFYVFLSLTCILLSAKNICTEKYYTLFLPALRFVESNSSRHKLFIDFLLSRIIKRIFFRHHTLFITYLSKCGGKFVHRLGK